MVRNLILALVAPALASAAIWPEQWGDLKRVSASPIAIEDKALWDEYGLEEAEAAEYENGGTKLRVEAYRLRDTTGALAAFQLVRGTSPSGQVVQSDNYVVRFSDLKQSSVLNKRLNELPKRRRAALPSTGRYLPRKNLIARSERYILGPVSLARFAPGIPESAAGFNFSSEAQVAEYRLGGGTAKLAIFNFPSPEMSRLQTAEFEKLPGAVVRRSGPLSAVFIAPPDAAAASRLLEDVKYQESFSWSEKTPTRRDNVGELILAVFTLAGYLLLVCVAGGLAFGVLRRVVFRRAGAAMTVLNLDNR